MTDSMLRVVAVLASPAVGAALAGGLAWAAQESIPVLRGQPAGLGGVLIATFAGAIAGCLGALLVRGRLAAGVGAAVAGGLYAWAAAADGLPLAGAALGLGAAAGAVAAAGFAGAWLGRSAPRPPARFVAA